MAVTGRHFTNPNEPFVPNPSTRAPFALSLSKCRLDGARLRTGLRKPVLSFVEGQEQRVERASFTLQQAPGERDR
jgi:hypothetical protein